MKKKREKNDSQFHLFVGRICRYFVQLNEPRRASVRFGGDGGARDSASPFEIMLSSVSSINKFHWCGNGDNSREEEKNPLGEQRLCAEICLCNAHKHTHIYASVCVCVVVRVFQTEMAVSIRRLWCDAYATIFYSLWEIPFCDFTRVLFHYCVLFVVFVYVYKKSETVYMLGGGSSDGSRKRFANLLLSVVHIWTMCQKK